MSDFDVKNSVCEICGNQATAGIQDGEEIRYTCQDHTMKVYDRIAAEAKEREAAK
jgi:hypothetical protein